MTSRIRILIVDDSATTAGLLKSIINKEPDMEVLGHARNGKEGVEMANRLKPDLVTMDIHMPVMDGHYATRMIMATTPVPIVVISSSVDKGEIPIAFRAIEEGAVSVIEKPVSATAEQFEASRHEIITTLRAMADVKVIRRRQPIAGHAKELIFDHSMPDSVHDFKAIAIAASTGGPQALQVILSNLPPDFPLPILIVQHISPGFINGLVDWLKVSTLLNVTVAENNQALENGTVYFAPDGYHLGIRKNNTRLHARLLNDAAINGCKPSATILFNSVVEVCGGHALGCILTGMGRDGADGLLRLRQAGGYTIAQDEKSCIVYGMPAVAINLKAACDIVPLDQIAAMLVGKVRRKSHPGLRVLK